MTEALHSFLSYIQIQVEIVTRLIVLENTAMCTQQYTSLTQPHHVQCVCLHVRNVCCSVLPLVRECVPHVLPDG
jgi:hypothetical protein